MLPLALWSYLDVVPTLSPQPRSKARLEFGLSPWDGCLNPSSSTVHHQMGQLKAGREAK